MQVKQSYGARRVAEIAVKVARCKAALPVATAAPESQNLAPAAVPEVETETRMMFVLRFPHLRESHLKAQRRMFAAIKRADLPMEMSPRLDGINALLGTGFTSSTQLSPDELHAVADAIESGRFSGAWQLDAHLSADDAPLPDAPPESEPETDTGTTPAPLESLDEIAMSFDLAQMRAANRARLLNSLRSERVLLETRLREVDHAILTA